MCNIYISSTYRRCQRDEELATVRVRTRVGHAQGVRSVVLQIRPKFVFELASPYTFATGTGPGGIARLYHETLDDSVEYVTVEVAVLRVHAEVLDRLRNVLAEEIHVDIAERRVDNRSVVYLLHVRGLSGRYDVFLRRLLVENVSVALLALRVLRFASREHVKAILLVSRAEQRRIRSVHFHRRVLGSLHLDGQRGGGFPRFSLYVLFIYKYLSIVTR